MNSRNLFARYQDEIFQYKLSLSTFRCIIIFNINFPIEFFILNEMLECYKNYEGYEIPVNGAIDNDFIPAF